MYYHFMLRDFAYLVFSVKGDRKAEKLFTESNDEKLKEFVLEMKSSLPEKEFYFYAGAASRSQYFEVQDPDDYERYQDGLKEFLELIGF